MCKNAGGNWDIFQFIVISNIIFISNILIFCKYFKINKFRIIYVRCIFNIGSVRYDFEFGKVSANVLSLEIVDKRRIKKFCAGFGSSVNSNFLSFIVVIVGLDDIMHNLSHVEFKVYVEVHIDS